MKLSVSLCSRAGFTETRIILDRRKNWAENSPTIPGENQPTVPGENPPAIPGENPPTVPGENPPDSADLLRKVCRGTQVQYIYSICTTIQYTVLSRVLFYGVVTETIVRDCHETQVHLECCHGDNSTGLSRGTRTNTVLSRGQHYAVVTGHMHICTIVRSVL